MLHTAPLLIVLILPLVVMGAGCGARILDEQLNSESIAPLSVVFARTNESANLEIAVVIEPGIILYDRNGDTQITRTGNYITALNMYEKNGMRLQFVDCMAQPESLYVRAGITFMVDNLDTRAHQFRIDSQVYQFNAYDFATVRVYKTGNFSIVCDKDKMG